MINNGWCVWRDDLVSSNTSPAMTTVSFSACENFTSSPYTNKGQAPRTSEFAWHTGWQNPQSVKHSTWSQYSFRALGSIAWAGICPCRYRCWKRWCGSTTGSFLQCLTLVLQTSLPSCKFYSLNPGTGTPLCCQ